MESTRLYSRGKKVYEASRVCHDTWDQFQVRTKLALSNFKNQVLNDTSLFGGDVSVQHSGASGISRDKHVVESSDPEDCILSAQRQGVSL